MSSKRNIIDSHVHFWILGKYANLFPTLENQPGIYKDYSIDDYRNDAKKLMLKHGVKTDGLVYINVNHSEKETDDIIELAKENPIIRGIVGWTDLTGANLEQTLKALKTKSNGKLCGIRHLMHDEEYNWVWQDDVQHGLGLLEKSGLACDLLLRPPHLKHVPKLATKFPSMKFVIDHIAKPSAKLDFENDSEWFEDIKLASQFSNVHCKISGLVPEAPKTWSIDLHEPYVKHVLDCFGYERCIYGADWPVFGIAENCGIENVFEIAETIVKRHYGDNELIWNHIFHDNCIKFYNLN